MANVIENVQEKLKRANENIRNLEAEIARFFESGEYPILPEHDRELLLKAIEYHKNRAIPLRFSVLTGEIIHHLRSCLDHIAWQFSTEQYRADHPRRIEFPIFDKKPVDKDSISRYDGKIKGITDGEMRLFIESLQPYNSSDPVSNPILILHKMDITDKHRELILSVPTGGRDFPPEMRLFIMTYQRIHPELTAADIAFQFKGHGKLRPQISFTDFGRREIEPVIQGLMELYNAVLVVIREFDYRWG